MKSGALQVKRAVLLLAAAGAVALTSLYWFVYTLWTESPLGQKVAAAQCVEPEPAVTENPNKMLFISCGDFLE